MRLLGKYCKNVLIALDQLIGAICGMDPDECISSFAAKLARNGNSTLARKIDFIFGRGHCEASIEEDEGSDGLIKPE